MGTVTFAARLLLAIVFATAAASKLADRQGTHRALADFGVPARWHRVGVWLLPLAELASVAALLVDRSARWGAVGAMGLLAVFSAVIASALIRGSQADCGCFGQLSSARVTPRTLLRNALLALPALLVAVRGAGASPRTWIDAAAGAGVVLGALLLALGPWHRLVRRLGGIDEQPAGEPWPVLPIGTPAPPFALPTVDGESTSLEALLQPGKPVVLVFLSPSCGSCVTLVPDLARWQTTLADRLTIALVAQGTIPELRRVMDEHGLRNMLVETDRVVADAYSAMATPSAVVIDPAGRVASRTMASSPMVEVLIRRAMATPVPGAAPEAPRLVIEYA